MDPASASTTPVRSRRNPRAVLACEHCRSRKVRCDGQNPCSGCRHSSTSCVYRASRHERKQATRRADEPLPPLLAYPNDSASSTVSSNFRTPTRLLNDPAHYKKLRELRAGIGISNKDTGSFQFYGPSSHFCFVQRIYQRINRKTKEPLLTPQGDSVPDSVEKWGLERFMFSVDTDDEAIKCRPEAYFSREMGDAFIHSYFDIIHPQVPVLVYSEIVELWNAMWQPPKLRSELKGEELLFMVLAIGARVSSFQGQQDTSLSEGWAEHFSGKVNGPMKLFENPSLRSTHLLLLKAFYAYQVMRPNEAYLYLGHAARSAMALGINRAQVVEGANAAMHRLRLTFWTIYIHERACSLYAGRPSSFRDELIDVPYPEDLIPLEVAGDSGAANHTQAATRCGWSRAMAGIGKIADRIFVDIYSSKSISTVAEAAKAHQTAMECDIELEAITRTLPVYLHFFDDTLPIGEGWQEVQRIILGCHYHITRMLMHRPALVFATFFDSKAEAEERAAGTMHVHDSIEASISSAKCIVKMSYDAFFSRYPGVKFDGSLATFLVSACMTLLYDVLDPKTTPDYARDTFTVVERGIQCLDQIQHVGPTNGKALSLDVMRVAKDALRSAGSYSQLDENLADSFPWLLQCDNLGSDRAPVPAAQEDQEVTMGYAQNPTMSTSDATGRQYISSLLVAPEVNYMSHWLEAGFQPEEIPNSLF